MSEVEIGIIALEREAALVGGSHGWNHANYVTAYGGDPWASPEVPERYRFVDSYYLSGYSDGVCDFLNEDYGDPFEYDYPEDDCDD